MVVVTTKALTLPSPKVFTAALASRRCRVVTERYEQFRPDTTRTRAAGPAPARDGTPPWHRWLPPMHCPPRQIGTRCSCRPLTPPGSMIPMPSHGSHPHTPCRPSIHGGNPGALGECALHPPHFKNLIQAAIMNLCNLG